MKSKEQLDRERDEIVTRHVHELRKAYVAGDISGHDHDRIGLLMQVHIADFLSLSDKAWEIFKRDIQESRDWRLENGCGA